MKKVKRESKLKNALPLYDEFLIGRLRKEWEDVESSVRKEEIKNRTKEVATLMAKSILVLLAVGGAIAVAAVAPNIFAVFGRHPRHRRFFDKDKFKEAKLILSKQGLVRTENINGSPLIKLTDKGKQRVIGISYRSLRLKTVEKWDGCWRVVLFDIPLKHKWARESFREKLKLMEFYPIQKSVFVSPYPCHEEIHFLCQLYNITGNVRLIETRLLGDDEKLKSYFGLT